MNTPKTLSGLLSALLSLLLHIPPDIHQAAGVALWFFVLDWISGVAANSGRISSGTCRQKQRDKLVCYALIVGIAHGIALITGAWAWALAGWWGVMASEGLSILENLDKIRKRSGINLGPAQPLIDRFSAFFAEGRDKDNKDG